MPETAKLVVVLAIICVVASGGLALVNAATGEKIAEQERLKEEMLRAEALVGPGEEVEFGEPKPFDDGEYFEGYVDGKLVGYVFGTVARKAYNEPVMIVVGVDAEKTKLTGVRIRSQRETPGLGAFMVVVRSGEQEPWFLRQFRNVPLEKVWLKKDNQAGEIDGITAATISSRAVTDAVRESFEKFVQATGETKEDVG